MIWNKDNERTRSKRSLRGWQKRLIILLKNQEDMMIA